MRLGWSRDEDGIITVFAHATDGRGAAVADFWIKPLVDNLRMTRADALEWQQQFAELLVGAHNSHQPDDGSGVMKSIFTVTAPLTVQVHFGNPKMARIPELTIRQMPECEGGGWYMPTDEAEAVAAAWNSRLPTHNHSDT